MLDQNQISHLNEYEKELLFNIDIKYGDFLEIVELIQDKTLHIFIKSPIVNNDLDLFYDKNTIVLHIGQWTHTHPETIDELILTIDKIINDEIIIWKVTRPDGYWYSGHYDLIEWQEDSTMVNEPDSLIEKGDRIERSTFNTFIENKVVE
jgi:hypothetical protein